MLGLTASKYISDYRVNNTDKIYSIYLITNVFTFIFGFITTLLIIIFASRIAINSLNSPSLTFDIKLGALLLFFTILNSAQVGVLSGLESFKTIAVNLFIATIIEILLLIIGAIYFSGSGAIIGMGIGFPFFFLLIFISIHRTLSNLKIAYC